jgi:hypothetical protein
LEDTLFVKIKSLDGNTFENVYMQGKFTHVIPMPNKMRPKCANSLIEFTNNVGILDEVVTDGAGKFTSRHTEFVKIVIVCIFAQNAPSQEEEPDFCQR